MLNCDVVSEPGPIPHLHHLIIMLNILDNFWHLIPRLLA